MNSFGEVVGYAQNQSLASRAFKYVPGDGGGRPEGSREFWFWPPVPPAVKRIRVTVSTLWEAAWAELDIPGRSG